MPAELSAKWVKILAEKNPRGGERRDPPRQKSFQKSPGKAAPGKGRENPPEPPKKTRGAKPLPFLPPGTDSGDLLLLVLLLLLYNESGDEEYLIILAAVFFMG